jgi:hypothetical protein
MALLLGQWLREKWSCGDALTQRVPGGVFTPHVSACFLIALSFPVPPPDPTHSGSLLQGRCFLSFPGSQCELPRIGGGTDFYSTSS